MSIVEAIFNHQKLYPIADGDMKISAGGKNWYVVPNQVIVPKGTAIYNENGNKLHISFRTNRDCTSEVDFFMASGAKFHDGVDVANPFDLYKLSAELPFYGDDGKEYFSQGYVKISDCVNPKWGGKTLLRTEKRGVR